MAFVPIQRRRMRDQIEDLLRHEIQLGTFMPGDRLPSIAQIARETSASYRTVQQALVRLQEQGLIAMRHGDGTYVQEPAPGMTLADTVLLCIDTQAHVYGDLHTLLTRELQQHNRFPATLDLSGDTSAEAFRRVGKSEIRSLIIHGHPTFPFHLLPTRTSSGQEIRIVSVLGHAFALRHSLLHRVVVDHVGAGQLVRDFLVSRGHRRIVVVGTRNMLHEALHTPGALRRDIPDLSSWQADGLQLQPLRTQTEDFPHVRVEPDHVQALFTGDDLPTAIFGLRDVDVHALQYALLKQFPEQQPDLIGYGNTPHSSLSLRPYSTIDWNLEEVARRAVAYLVDTSADASTPCFDRQIDWVPAQLIVR